MDAKQLLSFTKPEDIFPGDLAQAKVKYRELAKEWHPDTNKSKEATRVFQNITELYDLAVKQIEAGTFGGRSVLKTSIHTIPYLKARSFELGMMYLGEDHVTYVVDKGHKTFYDNGVANSSIFSFKNDKMKNEIARYLPRNVTTFKTDDKHLGLMVPKTKDLLLLADVLEHFNDEMPVKHAAWVGSSMHNIACYLHWAGIVHNDISPETYFISPSLHSGALLGGWWYASKVGKKLSVVPRRTHDWLPWEVRTKKIALHETDLELIRATVRELVGDITGRKFGKEVPKKMSQWLKTVASSAAVDEYSSWIKMLEDSFGKRKFTPLELTQEDLYNTK
jgi:hypothetical protein